MKIPGSFQEWWQGTEEGKEAIAAAVKDGVTERAALVEEIAELRKGLKRALPDHLKATEAAAKKLEKARQAFRAAEHDNHRAHAIVQSLKHQADTQIARLEHELREGAAPAVREFLEATGDLWEKERREWEWSAPVHNGVKMPAQIRVAQIRAIEARAELLLLEPDPEVAERELVRLRQEVADPLAAVA